MRAATSDTTGADEVRHCVHDGWAAVAGAWARHADYADARCVAVTETMLELAAPQLGERVLELACGPGSVGLAAAAGVGPEGEVVLSDVVPEMTSIAAARAAASGVGNVRTSVLDFEQIDEPDASYDVVLCREGLMFAAEPGRAVREISRVLRPGGRVAVAVWGPRAANPWLGVVFDALGAQLGMPVPPPHVPGPFSLDDAETLWGLLTDAGLTGVAVVEVPTPVRDDSFDDWWSRTSSLAGPLAQVLASLPDDVHRGLRTRLHDAVAPYQTPSGLAFPGVSLVAAAHRVRS